MGISAGVDDDDEFIDLLILGVDHTWAYGPGFEPTIWRFAVHCFNHLTTEMPDDDDDDDNN